VTLRDFATTENKNRNIETDTKHYSYNFDITGNSGLINLVCGKWKWA